MKTAIMKSDAFNRVISCVKDFTQKYGASPVFGYIRLEFSAADHTVTAVAVDGYRMSVEHAVAESEEDFTAYVKGNVKLPKGEDVVISVSGSDCVIKCAGAMFGWEQPEGEFLDWEKVLPTSPVQYEIAFNGDFLMSALISAKLSAGQVYKNPVVLEFRSPTEPVIIRTNDNDIKMVLPIRIKNSHKED